MLFLTNTQALCRSTVSGANSTPRTITPFLKQRKTTSSIPGQITGPMRVWLSMLILAGMTGRTGGGIGGGGVMTGVTRRVVTGATGDF